MLYLLQRNDCVADLHVSDTFSHALDNASTLVSSNDGEGSFGVLSAQHVGICVAHASVVHLDADFMGSGREDLDVLDDQVFASFPGHGSLADDALSRRVRHDGASRGRR